jgi:hypothetical protein
MANKKPNMKDAISKSAKGESVTKEVVTTVAADKYKQPSRVGKVNVTGYFNPAVKSSLRSIQAKHPDKNIQVLLAEALNDLFAKYNVPQTAHLE